MRGTELKKRNLAIVGLTVAGLLLPTSTALATESVPVSPTPAAAQLCTITMTAEPAIFKETRKAAKRWNKHTRALDEYPYRVRVVKGKVVKSDPLKAADGQLGPAAAYVSRAKMWEFGAASAGFGGTGLNGFAVQKSRSKAAWRHNLIAHEFGHVLGVGHDSKRGKLMSPSVHEHHMPITKRALKELKSNAESTISRWAPDCLPSADEPDGSVFNDLDLDGPPIPIENPEDFWDSAKRGPAPKPEWDSWTYVDEEN